MRSRLRDGRFSIALKAMALAVPFVLLKLLAIKMGWERIDAVGVVTSLIGGVIFTLAIILSGVLADFKESERLLSELAGSVRRLHADFALLAQGERLHQMRRELRTATEALTADLREGSRVRVDRVAEPLARLDVLLVEAARAPVASGSLSFVQNALANVVRNADRLRVIVETTFLRPGYVFAGLAVAGALGALTLARIPGTAQALGLHFFASFLLVGLMLLIYDLDNPFQGSVRASTSSLDDLERFLHTEASTVAVVATARS